MRGLDDDEPEENDGERAGGNTGEHEGERMGRLARERAMKRETKRERERVKGGREKERDIYTVADGGGEEDGQERGCRVGG